MDDDLTKLAAGLVRRLVLLASRDEEFLAGLHALGTAISRAADPAESPFGAEPERIVCPSPALKPEPEAGPESAPEVVKVTGIDEPRPSALELASRLTFGGPDPVGPSPRPVADPDLAPEPEEDLELLEAYCRWKAESCRPAGGPIAPDTPERRALLEQARALDPVPWPRTMTFDDETAALLAGNFEALAEALALVRSIPELERDHQHGKAVLLLLAEALSALRLAVARVRKVVDSDQDRAFRWLKRVADRGRIYVDRYMKLSDPAEPARHRDLRARIADRRRIITEGQQHDKARRKALGRLRHHAKRVRENQGTADDWAKIVEAVNAMVACGLPPSSLEIRETLLPIQDAVPDDEPVGPPSGMTLALREVERYLETRPEAVDDLPDGLPTAEVAEVARKLAGREVVLIGGVPNTHSRSNLERAFGLAALRWEESREHEPIARYEADVSRPEVALVLLAIRWSSHSFGDIQATCKALGKPLVRLKGGYGVNRVAAEILQQVSGQLGDG